MTGIEIYLTDTDWKILRCLYQYHPAKIRPKLLAFKLKINKPVTRLRKLEKYGWVEEYLKHSDYKYSRALAMRFWGLTNEGLKLVIKNE